MEHTALTRNTNISEEQKANVYLKREDLQVVRSYKIRGAYNKIISLSEEELRNGVVCASAGNHAQGVAFSCQRMGIRGTIFMPNPTPQQKINQVKMFGREFVDVIIIGDSYDDSYKESVEFCNTHGAIFVHPFNDLKIIEGQGTIGLEVLTEADLKIDYLFIPIGGGLGSGVGSVFRQLSPHTNIIGVEPAGAPAMKRSLEAGELVTLPEIDPFVDGAATKMVGHLTLGICKEALEDIVLVPEGKICTTILKLYNKDAIVVEPAGALSIAALDLYSEEIKGKNVVCLASGGNNDIVRMEEIKERSMLYEGTKHYFIVRFPQRAGALREFVIDVLGPADDITHFEYSKKTSRERGPAVVGIELKNKVDFPSLLQRMKQHGFYGDYLNDKPDLFQYLV